VLAVRIGAAHRGGRSGGPGGAPVGAFALQLKPPGGYQLILGCRAALASATHQELNPAQADQRAAGALVGKGGQQRAQ
jgi:hypothetical protein